MANHPDMPVVTSNDRKQAGNQIPHHDSAASSQPSNDQIDFIQEEAVSALLDLLKGMFDGIDDSFFELANSSHNNNEQNRYFEAMREIRIKRKGIENGFARNLSQNFHSPHPSTKVSSSDSHAPEVSFEALALVQDDDLEEDVAVKTMSGKAKANFQSTLLQLEARFQAYFKNNSCMSPLDPELVVQSFTKTCLNIDLEIREKLIVYKQFDRFVMSNMSNILDVCNLRLIKMGILPDLKFKSKSKVAPKSSHVTGATPITNSAESSSATQPAYLGTTAQPAQFSFQDIQSLLHRATNLHGATNGASTQQTNAPSQQLRAAEYLADAELINLLSGVQPRFSENDLLSAPVQLIDIRTTLQSILSAQEKEAKSEINQVDEDLINLVSMLFEFILDDYNLSAPIQVLISRLQIPLLKVVIRDNSFFNNAQHPARQLLNSLAKAGIGWSDASEKQKDKLYNQIHQVVHRILDEFDGNIEIFEELNNQFSEFMKKEERKSSIIEQRTREAEKGRIKSQRAQQEVEQAIRSRFEQHTLPAEARDVIQNGWSRVMFLAYLKNDTMQSWKRSLRVLDELTWCLTPKIETDQRQRWVKVVPILLKEIRTGLQNVSYNTSRLEEMISRLKDLLTTSFKQQVEVPKPKQVKVEKPSIPQTAVQKQKELEDSLIAQYVEQVDALKDGCWIEFSLVNGSHFRCKLSAHIDEGNCLIFVNRMGLKVVEKTREELAHEIRKGRVRILEQGLLFDRALNSVIGGLRKKSENAA